MGAGGALSIHRRVVEAGRKGEARVAAVTASRVTSRPTVRPAGRPVDPPPLEWSAAGGGGGAGAGGAGVAGGATLLAREPVSRSTN